MKESIGGVYILNAIIIFIVLVFAFLAATLLYYKAYKVNNRMANAIEKYEGYNNLSYNEIEDILSFLHYNKAETFTTSDCPTKKGVHATSSFAPKHKYCIYEIAVDNNYDKYGVLTYIGFKLPGFGFEFEVPIYAETERIYHFTES